MATHKSKTKNIIKREKRKRKNETSYLFFLFISAICWNNNNNFHDTVHKKIFDVFECDQLNIPTNLKKEFESLILFQKREKERREN